MYNEMFQIQSIKSQIENMKLQIQNIELQSNNMSMMNNPSEQLLNLSIQMINTGIQAFNTGKNMAMNVNIDKFYDQLRNISEQINSFINENNNNKMRFQQQIMMQQQMMMQPNLIDNNVKYLSAIFQFANKPDFVVRVKYGTTVEELLNIYMNKVKIIDRDKYYYLFNAKKINKVEKNLVENYFLGFPFIKINVIEVKSDLE